MICADQSLEFVQETSRPNPRIVQASRAAVRAEHEGREARSPRKAAPGLAPVELRSILLIARPQVPFLIGADCLKSGGETDLCPKK